MPQYAIIAPDGSIRMSLNTPFPEELAHQLQEGDRVAESLLLPGKGWFDEDLVAHAIPPNDDKRLTFNYATRQWEDMRTAADKEAALMYARGAATLSKADFLIAAVRVGILSKADASLAAAGQLPTAFASVVETWPEETQFEVGIKWAALTRVDRMHAFINALAAALGITDEQLDTVFGIVPENL